MSQNWVSNDSHVKHLDAIFDEVLHGKTPSGELSFWQNKSIWQKPQKEKVLAQKNLDDEIFFGEKKISTHFFVVSRSTLDTWYYSLIT